MVDEKVSDFMKKGRFTAPRGMLVWREALFDAMKAMIIGSKGILVEEK